MSHNMHRTEMVYRKELGSIPGLACRICFQIPG